MNALWGLFILTGIIYGVFIDATFWKKYLILLVLWTIYVNLQKNGRDNPRRKSLLIASWAEPSDPTSYIVNEVNMREAKEYVKKLNEQ